MEDLVLPEDWARASAIDLKKPRKQALRALERADLANYYRPELNYCGATFANLGRNDPYDISGDDLHAVAMLSVTVRPIGTRHLLYPGEHRECVLDALRAVPIDVTLAQASGEDLVAAYALHKAVMSAIKNPNVKTESNPWVTASKLCARKRPHLIPVRDNVVGKKLGPGAIERASVYWQTMRGLLTDTPVIAAIAAARERLRTEATVGAFTLVVDTSDLRFLDAALWKDLVRGTKHDTADDEAE